MTGFAAFLVALLTAVLLLGPDAQAQPAQGAAGATAAINEYRLGAGDVVRIAVFQNPDLTLETRVTEAGVISYPLLGVVRVGGQSVTEAERRIADGLRRGNFVKSPQVTLVVLQVRGNQASVLGQVNRPGRYPIEVADMRLTDLLAMAGGTAACGADLVVITGARNGQPFSPSARKWTRPRSLPRVAQRRTSSSSTATRCGSTASPSSTSTAKCSAPAPCGWSAA